MSITASLIVKNELGRYLQPCIGHLHEFCDQIVVVDDGSTDRTGEWLDDNTDERMIVKHIDPDDGFFAGHEGRRRQALLDFTLAAKPDWVLAIDADEFISDGGALRRFCEAPHLGGTLVMREVWQADELALNVRMDGGWREHPVPILWNANLVARRGGRRMLRIPDRALACGREPEAARRLSGRFRPTDVGILHFGWTNEAGRQARFDRYVTADGGKYHAGSHLDSIMWPDEKVILKPAAWPLALRPYRQEILDRVCATS